MAVNNARRFLESVRHNFPNYDLEALVKGAAQFGVGFTADELRMAATEMWHELPDEEKYARTVTSGVAYKNVSQELFSTNIR